MALWIKLPYLSARLYSSDILGMILNDFWAGEISQYVKVPTTKVHDLSLNPRTCSV